MTFLAPQFLWIGAAVAALVAAIHFIVTQQPRSEAFPTARFVPESPVQAVSRATRPTDLLLLLLRILAILSIAAAFAQPILSANRPTLAQIILADLSRSSRSISEVRDSSKKYFHPGDLLIAFDSIPRTIDPDSLVGKSANTEAGNLSAALTYAIRSSAQLRDRADSVSLILISPLPAAAFDAATDTIRSLWPGAIQLVRIAPRERADVTTTLPVRAQFAADDPLR